MDKFNCPIVFTHEAISSRSPATRKVIRHVSFGRYNLSLEPLATNWDRGKTTERQIRFLFTRLSWSWSSPPHLNSKCYYSLQLLLKIFLLVAKTVGIALPSLAPKEQPIYCQFEIKIWAFKIPYCDVQMNLACLMFFSSQKVRIHIGLHESKR